MVIAAFLNKHLLEPRERRLRAEGHSEGFSEGMAQARAQARAETLAEVRSFLQEHGLDLDLDEIPLPDADDTESENAERR